MSRGRLSFFSHFALVKPLFSVTILPCLERGRTHLSRSHQFRGKESSMSSRTPSIRIGIYGQDTCVRQRAARLRVVAGRDRRLPHRRRGRAGAGLPRSATAPGTRSSTAFTASSSPATTADGKRPTAEAEELCMWCNNHHFPLLGIDHGLHLLNTAHGGTVYLDLPRDLPEALQHRHPPERGLRHAINVVPETVPGGPLRRGRGGGQQRASPGRAARGARFPSVCSSAGRRHRGHRGGRATGSPWACSGIPLRPPHPAWTFSCSAVWSTPAAIAGRRKWRLAAPRKLP